jgi:hypothetical protein
MNPLSLQLDTDRAEPGTVDRVRQLLQRHPGNAEVELRFVFANGGEHVLHLSEPADPFDGGLLRALGAVPGLAVEDAA